MESWTRGIMLALAKESCVLCAGYGARKRGDNEPCKCVLRAVFRQCYERFQQCRNKHQHVSTVNLHLIADSTRRRFLFGRKDEEFAADFELVSRRTLTIAEFELFRLHYLLGNDWRLCCGRLRLDRGTFFHAVYRIQQKLGRIFGELKPYPLYPLDEYFSGAIEPCSAFAGTMPLGGRRSGALRPVL